MVNTRDCRIVLAHVVRNLFDVVAGDAAEQLAMARARFWRTVNSHSVPSEEYLG